VTARKKGGKKAKTDTKTGIETKKKKERPEGAKVIRKKRRRGRARRRKREKKRPRKADQKEGRTVRGKMSVNRKEKNGRRIV